MERQQAITLAQVLAKRQRAKDDSLHYMERALAAKTEEVYEANLARACKAAADYEVWRKVEYSLAPY